ncbi:uncharacterized protein [Phyllobates terribilis]|uniref:uncharacterized protein n=1 Tax=Phyllobates terribilis TaxID=111132 RepID=UPI003CCB0541
MNPARSIGVPSPLGNTVQIPQNQTLGGSQPQILQFSDQRGNAFGQTVAQTQSQAAYAQFQANIQAQGQQFHSQNPIKTNVGPGVSPSGSISARKAVQRPPFKPQASSVANTGSPLKTMELAPAAQRSKRKKKELEKKQIPRNVASIIPESAVYSQLVELEGRMDAVLKRKKMDVQEWVKNPPHFRKTLRINVFNTFANQSDQSGESPSWTLKILGRILDEDKVYPKFSSFCKRITIYLDQNLYPDTQSIVWENSRSRAVHEGFEVKRKGDKEFTAIIRLEMNYIPERFKLSPTLSEVLGFEVETRSRVITALWHYVKTKKLHDPNDPAVFICDPPLRKVFGDEKIKFIAASLKLSQHLGPVPPIELHHTIKLSGESPSGNTCYDVPVDVPVPLQKEMSKFLGNVNKNKEIDAYDEEIASAIRKINEHRSRRSFFLGFSESPAEFINALIASQERDLTIVAGDAIRNAEKERSADFYTDTWVEDAVTHYLNRKPAMGANIGGNI